MTTTTIMPKQRTGRPRKNKPPDDRVAVMDMTATVSALFTAMVTPSEIREILCLGTRGDGKTIGVLAGMIGHAAKHKEHGFPLPAKWIGFTDTFSAHKAKTFESLDKPFWKGAWRQSDGGHVWTAVSNGQPLVELHLFGIEDQGAMDRVRTECVGVWGEEVAPTAVLGVSAGVDESAWGMALTSQRIPTHHRIAVITENYPDEDHWSWQRFQPSAFPLPDCPPPGPEREAYYRLYAPHIAGRHPADPTRAWFRIPAGERADATQRAEWAHALRDRPDLLRRLIHGLPGSIMLGPQVADGFSLDLHVMKERLKPVIGEPLALGVDFGLTPTAIIGQVVRGVRRVYASLTLEHGGITQLIDNEILPWLAQHASWALRNRQMIYGCYDVSGQTAEQSDIERDPVSILESKLPGLWFPGPVNWDARKHVLLSALHHHVSPGQVSLQIDPIDAKGLMQALGGRWHYAVDRQGQIRRDLPKKPNHPWEDYGDAFIYWLWSLTSEAQPPGPLKVQTHFFLEPSPLTTEYAFNL